jgi:hypothetical protein
LLCEPPQIKVRNRRTVKGEGNTTAASLHRIQTEATKVAMSMAINQKSELLVHDEEEHIS